MAIVQENVRIIKLLLDHGANVHERCLGTFFLPDDQKNDANWTIRQGLQFDQDSPNCSIELGNLDLQSNHFESCKTDYYGLVSCYVNNNNDKYKCIHHSTNTC